MEPFVVPIVEESDILIARRRARELAREMGFGLADQTCLATAVSELVRNVIQYAGRGQCTIQDVSSDRKKVIQVCVEDQGPGISDIERAMRDGFSTGGGLGAGLPGSRRLVHRFEIHSQPGNTRIVIEMFKEH